MNYERVIAYDFPRSGVTALHDGSSINRRHNEAKKIVRRKKEKEILGEDVPGNGQDGLLFSNETGELVHKARYKLSAKRKTRKAGDQYTLSSASGRKIRNKCAAFFHAGARAFITLTFIQDLTDKKALDCLKNILHQWRKDRINKPDFNYLWVAERQHNGRIHFHIMVNDYFNIEKENTRWIRIQYNAGLKFKNTKKNFTFEREHIEAWEKKGRLQEILNPFDIEKINTQSHLSYYLTKYITKTANNEDKASFDFLPWGCSNNISNMYTGTSIMPEVFFEATTEENTLIVEKQFIRKSTGEVVEPGTQIIPQIHKNDWAISINILNRPHFHSWLYDVKNLNKKIAAGERPPVVEYDADHYFNDFCRRVTQQEFEALAITEQGTNAVEIAGTKILLNAVPVGNNEYYGLDTAYRKIYVNEIALNGNFLN